MRKRYYEAEESFDNKDFYREQKTKRREEDMKQIPITGLEDYFITKGGLVFSSKKTKIRNITPTDNMRGYLGVPLYSPLHKTKTGIAKRYYVHRLVAITFIPNPENKPCVNHINNNRKDNRVENLEWVTHRENTMHSQKCKTFPVGERVYMAKLTEKEVLEMRRIHRETHITHEQLGKMYGISRRVAGDVVNMKSWKHVQEIQGTNS